MMTAFSILLLLRYVVVLLQDAKPDLCSKKGDGIKFTDRKKGSKGKNGGEGVEEEKTRRRIPLLPPLLHVLRLLPWAKEKMGIKLLGRIGEGRQRCQDRPCIDQEWSLRFDFVHLGFL